METTKKGRPTMTFLKNHREILSKGNLDNFSNFFGEVLPDSLVNVIGRHRDSDCLEESNFQVALKMLGGESEEVQVHRIGHWAIGWIEEIFINSENKDLLAIAEKIVKDLEDYPVLDEMHLGELEQEEGNRVWKDCYTEQERIDYIREHRYQFDFSGMEDLMGCVRGKFFVGYASDLIY